MLTFIFYGLFLIGTVLMILAVVKIEQEGFGWRD